MLGPRHIWARELGLLGSGVGIGALGLLVGVMVALGGGGISRNDTFFLWGVLLGFATVGLAVGRLMAGRLWLQLQRSPVRPLWRLGAVWGGLLVGSAYLCGVLLMASQEPAYARNLDSIARLGALVLLGGTVLGASAVPPLARSYATAWQDGHSAGRHRLLLLAGGVVALAALAAEVGALLLAEALR